MRRHEALLRTRATRIARLRAALAAAEARAAAYQDAAFRGQLTLLRQREMEAAVEAHRCVCVCVCCAEGLCVVQG